MPRLFSTLRGRATAALFPTESKAVVPVAFAQYYSELATRGVHMRAQDWPIERAIADGYDRVIWCFKSVNTIAADSARLPYRLREGEGEDDPIVDDHPMYRVLNKQANPVETGQVFRKRLSAQVSLSKRGVFVEVGKSNGGTIKRLDLLPPDRTEPIPDRDGGIDHFRLTRRDGSIRNLDFDKVRWFREPHPTDPYMGVTPLEAAGLSIELDHAARLYNASFMANDGRPGGILAVRDTAGGTGDIDPVQQKRLEDRFGKGPVEAGKLSVIAGELSYVDTAARPRDMAYGATSKNSKAEVLGAFGMSEVVLGHSADQTYANADAALYNYWTRTIPAHNDILLAGFDEDSEDDLYGFFDTSKVPVLERAAKEKRAEAREEFTAGLRSIWSYMVLAHREDEVEETPFTRALYIPTGRNPIPAKTEDMEALGLAVPSPDQGTAPPAVEGGAPADGAPAIEPPPNTGQGGNPPTPDQQTTPPAGPAGNGPAPAGPARAALEALTAGKALTGGEGDPKVTLTYRVERKSASSGTAESSPDLSATDALESALTGTLAALSVRWCDRAAARLSSPKARKHTRHWTPEYGHDTRVGTKAIDAPRAVDEDTWQAEAEAAAHPLIEAAAVTAAVALFTDFATPVPDGMSMTGWATRVVARTVTETVALVGRAARNQAAALVVAINRADQEGASLAKIRDAVTEHGARMSSWARGVSTQAATTATGGARDDAARETVAVKGDTEVSRTWFSRRDEVVRPTHSRETGADGQVRGLDEPFIVGTALLMRPGDPDGPLRECAGCRCFLRHRARATGRWTTAPARLVATG